MSGTLTATAPGKVMLMGEYSVLCGHPALVMAANRRVQVSLRPAPHWQLFSDGVGPETDIDWDATAAPESPAAALLWHVAQALSRPRQPLRLDADSSALQHRGHKLGLGSSAAVSVALANALAQLQQQPALDLPAQIALHNRLQGAKGSGFDVAAALHGGWFRFQHQGESAAVTRLAVPEVQLAFIWTGTVARTGDFVNRFRQWQQQTRHSDQLVAALGATVEQTLAARSGNDFLEGCSEFRQQLQALASAAALPIFEGGHQPLQRLADRFGICYKPCGAGGGDLGLAASLDPERLAAFRVASQALGFEPVNLECDPDGVQVQ